MVNICNGFVDDLCERIYITWFLTIKRKVWLKKAIEIGVLGNKLIARLCSYWLRLPPFAASAFGPTFHFHHISIMIVVTSLFSFPTQVHCYICIIVCCYTGSIFCYCWNISWVIIFSSYSWFQINIFRTSSEKYIYYSIPVWVKLLFLSFFENVATYLMHRRLLMKEMLQLEGHYWPQSKQVLFWFFCKTHTKGKSLFISS